MTGALGEQVAGRPRTDRDPASGALPALPAADFPIVGLGASAGGLDACKKFLEALPPGTGMAFVLIQHLDPTHESMMVALLKGHTTMTVRLATDGAAVQPEHLYLIPPGSFLAIRNGSLHLTAPRERHGARLPFDFFLRSLADDAGPRAIAVVLSGSGSDGSLGARAIRAKSGLVIAQDPAEAEHTGMPDSAIGTGAVDLVLPTAGIARALAERGHAAGASGDGPDSVEDEAPPAWLHDIISFLRTKTPHRFASYKSGTLRRRIERRIAMVLAADAAGYLAILRKDPTEVQRLASDLLINVTSFFRDPDAFAVLEKDVVPGLLRDRDLPLRIWVAGCSSGEETYSIAMLCAEAIAATDPKIRLQVFASDIDPEAIALARTGLYPHAIEADVSAARLARFFTKEDHGYRISPELRGAIVFTVQDLLVDPPFSRLDLVSCRNLLIYLRVDAQQKVLQRFHFALREGGILFLGSSEIVRGLEDLFAAIPGTGRLYRRLGGTRPDVADPVSGGGAAAGRPGNPLSAQWQGELRPVAPQAPGPGDLARRMLVDTYAPASVLINARREVLFSAGPTDRYLHLPSGQPTRDVLAMVRDGLRANLADAIEQARATQGAVTVTGARIIREAGAPMVSIRIQPARPGTDKLLMISFLDEAGPQATAASTGASAPDATRTGALERELDATRKELDAAIRDLAAAREDERAGAEEAMSATEEYQSTNEELLTSKEELQSLNEELTALNGQLHETLERQRSTANDLQNILDSSSIATLFLDREMKIRFFTPAARSIFGFIATDIGRPLADLAPRSTDTTLLADAGSVLDTLQPVGREVTGPDDAWSMRRILPYRTSDNGVEGVVITYADISELKAAARKVEAARRYSEAVINTIRQPLVVLDRQLHVVSANSAFHQVFATDAASTAGRPLALLAEPPAGNPGLAAFIEQARSDAAAIDGCEIETATPRLGRRVLLLNAARIRGEDSSEGDILLAVDDITERSLAAEALEVAKRNAEQASLGKSRFLAAASHDLRQPLQTMTILLGLLAAGPADADTSQLIARLEGTVSVMSGILNTLLDINQLEAGIVRAEFTNFPVNDLLAELRAEFADSFAQRGLGWRVMRCSEVIRSDPRLLGHMIRNLISNAIKYTRRGRVLLGCRRRGDRLRIEVWDTGIGIAETDTGVVFEEFHQLDNPARERSRGLGLGLSIVRRLADLLGHRIDVGSKTGSGSVFAIEVQRGAAASLPTAHGDPRSALRERPGSAAILIVEDDPEIGDLLRLLLRKAGYRVSVAADGLQAIAQATHDGAMPDLVIADYNLPGPLNGVEIVARLKREPGHEILPAIILTGDIATQTLRDIASQTCVHLTKPVRADALLRQIHALLSPRDTAAATTSAPVGAAQGEERGTVFVVDDEPDVREAMRELLEVSGWAAETYASGEAFLAADHAGRTGCVLVDALMPGMSGLELLRRLTPSAHRLAAIVITGSGDIHMSVEAMQAGALDFVEKPMGRQELLSSIARAFESMKDPSRLRASQQAAAERVATLTGRQRQILDLVLTGHPSKNIAADLGISQRTVENHRAVIMKKMGAASVPALVRIGIAASRPPTLPA